MSSFLHSFLGLVTLYSSSMVLAQLVLWCDNLSKTLPTKWAPSPIGASLIDRFDLDRGTYCPSFPDNFAWSLNNNDIMLSLIGRIVCWAFSVSTPLFSNWGESCLTLVGPGKLWMGTRGKGSLSNSISVGTRDGIYYWDLSWVSCSYRTTGNWNK